MAANRGSKATQDMATNKAASATEDIEVATSYNFSHDDVVTLVIGPEKTKMTVHGTYLARDSEFFKAALKKEWVEGQTRVIKLPEEDPKTMAQYMTFIYHKTLPPSDVTPTEQIPVGNSYLLLVDLYLCSERFLNRRLQRAIIVEILRLTLVKDSNGVGWYPTGLFVNMVYRGTPEGSPMRRLLVDLHVMKGCKSWLTPDLEPQFVFDIASAFYDKLRTYKTIEDFRITVLRAGDYL